MRNIISVAICLYVLISGSEQVKNKTISTLKLAEDFEPEGGFDKILYSFLDGDNTVLQQYLNVIREIFVENLFSDKFNFLKDIKLKCIPKIYFRLKKIKQSDFKNCQLLNSNLINIFGKRVLDACKKSDSIIECLLKAQDTLKREANAMEEDIVELYLNEIIGGKQTCMGDVIKQLKIFQELVQNHCN
ncbi:hypothetical protein WA026_017184 [Henosepilachna vigintioctopunctata]|uniref:Secreted protein n=1 Tax=Henosepilachna vigintioctopunctata TaxID=420089 RepID=A0AAW1UKA4_9CUCU